MNKSHLTSILLITILVLGISFTAYILLKGSISNETLNQKLHTYEIVKAYPHDTNAFTEGLIFQNGVLYEGTGLYGESELKKMELENGNILQSHSLPDNFFGEGITIFDEKIIQLTWLENTGFVYDEATLKLLANLTYATQGWGITTDGKKLIMSDGTSKLYFLDPETYQTTETVEVQDQSEPLSGLNELEYVKGDIYANIYKQKKIAIIDIISGQVKSWVDLNGLSDPSDSNPDNVLNGIAYDVNGDRLFVTGKRWTQLFEINLISEQ